MKSENMVKAYGSFVEFEKTLRLAHTDAIDPKDQFAEILIFQMLEEATQTHWVLKRMDGPLPHPPAFLPQQRRDPPIPIPRMLCRQCHQPFS